MLIAKGPSFCFSLLRSFLLFLTYFLVALLRSGFLVLTTALHAQTARRGTTRT